jgi:hypothetical protein
MKTLVVSIFALAMLGAGAANAASVGVGAHIGPVGIGVLASLGAATATTAIAAAGATRPA